MNEVDINSIIENEELREQLKALVLERINVMPDNISLAIGSSETTKGEILHHVEAGDEIGTQMMVMELDFLRDLASGAIYENE